MSFTKNKDKRSRSSSSETDSSFVKNVTSRMSGLLPATITKWFGSPSSSAANGSAQTADATDSSTEDEAPESPVTIQPPAKRMRYSSLTKDDHLGSSDVNCTNRNIGFEPYVSYDTIQSPPGRATFSREPNYISTPYRSPNEETVVDKNEVKTITYKPQYSMSAFSHNVSNRQKSLFDSSSNNEASKGACVRTASNTIKDPKQPYFKPSLLGSPFYPGRTTYGGASTSYMNQPYIKSRKNTLVNESSKVDNNISHSARRIMDLLENYSSPLNEAKRIPVVSYNKNDSLNSSTCSNTSVTKSLSNKMQELHVPSIASILRVKQRSRLNDTTTAARQIIASHSSTMHEYNPYPAYNDASSNSTSNKTTTKVKSRLTRPARWESSDFTPPVNLPEAVLQIDQSNLPKFSFETKTKETSSTLPTPTSRQPLSKTVQTEITTRTTETATHASEPLLKVSPFKFSSPVKLASDSSQPPKTPSTFTFGSPERSIDQAKVGKDNKSSTVSGVSQETGNTVTKHKDWQCPDCWVNNKPEVENCVCCGCKKKQDKCTVCKLASTQPGKEKCINCAKVTINNIDKPLTPKEPAVVKWTCADCWVKNDESADKCICCGAKNPKVSTDKSSANVTATAATWKCDECWINNKSSDSKCAACGTAKPGDKSGVATTTSFFTTPSKPVNDTLKMVIAKQSDKWECPGCLVRNENDKAKCVCCDHEKPGTEKQKALEEKPFNFGTVSGFKFGIPAQTQEAAKPAEVKAVVDSEKLQQSETNNNVFTKTTNFSFGLPAKKTEDETDSKKEKTEQDSAPKLNFTFGIPKPSAPSTTSAPFVVPINENLNKPAESVSKPEDKEKPQEVPTVTFSLPKRQEPVKPVTTNIFASPISTPAESKSQILPPMFGSPVTAVKTDTTTNTLAAPTTATSEAAPKPTFTFSPKPVTTLSSAPTAPLSSGVSFSSPLQPPAYTSSNTALNFSNPLQSTPSTTSSTPSLFQKPVEAPAATTASLMFSNTTTGSLFQKPAATTTTAGPPGFSTSTPLFSFGTNNSTPVQQEKPKFNFTFGSTPKSEAPSPFKLPTISNASENKFTLGNGPNNANGLSVGSNVPTIGNVMGGGLGAGNALSAGSPLDSGTPNVAANTLSTQNNLTPNIIGGDSVVPNSTLGSNALQAGTGSMFGPSTVQKEGLWPSSNSNVGNIFVPATTANTLQKPATFTFGSTSSAFGGNNNAPTFGTNAQPQSVFGMSNQNGSSMPSLFGSSAPNQSTPAVFGATPAQAPAAPAPAMGLFGSPAPNVGTTPTFGTPNQSIPSFETPSLTPGSTPAFTFGAAQPQMPVFGFGQQSTPQQPGGVYSFGSGGPVGAPQFNIGNAGSQPPQQRRIRKAVRRNR